MKASLIFITIVCLTCCQKHTKNIDYSNPSDSSSVDVEQYDSVFINYVNRYFIAIENRSTSDIVELLDPSVGDYLKKEFPNEYQVNTMNSIATEMFFMLDKTEKELGVELNYVTGNILNRVIEEDTLIFTMEIFMQYKQGLDTHSFGEEILGISTNKGMSWTVLNKDPRTFRQILQMNVSQNIVSKVK